MLAKKHKPISDGEEIVKPGLQKFAQRVGDKSIEKKSLCQSRQLQDVSRSFLVMCVSKCKNRVHACSFFSLALDESADICDVAQ